MKNKELEYNDETEDESITEKYKHNYDLDMEKEKTNKYYLIIMYFQKKKKLCFLFQITRLKKTQFKSYKIGNAAAPNNIIKMLKLI